MTTGSRTMRAVRLFEHGGPSVLQNVEVPIPTVGPGDVLIRVRATALNRWDLNYRAGILPKTLPGRPSWPLPFQLGRDAAGDIVEVGSDVQSWEAGDRVVQLTHPACGLCHMCVRGKDNLCINTAYPGHQIFGGYAEYIVRSQHEILRIPEGVDYAAAAATLWSYTTPLNCAANRAPIGFGETVLITGASGGLAIAAAQVARLHGATVIGTTTKPDRSDELEAAGYDHILNSLNPFLPEQVKELTNGLGVDAVWDCVGGNEFMRLAIESVRLGGTIAVMAINSPKVDIPSESFIAGEITITGVRAASRRDQELCMTMLGQGRIRPVIDKVYPLKDAVLAHEYLEGRHQIGKVLLAP
ncbi:quinone oxidoreductase family protein [Rhodococcus sp. MSC1_016]|jgi:NADPH:quinone reductase-like Zn-dependent oxidoreductase|uniref:quinone oxidoreductase family protein n=1 Tax=Rhodococcus sp. MSC1_016 TaxID=2909266 RepID=UPI002030BC8D|nr:zinc-binding dehydrogenase [Rhodococcus sp. MSC1_016]